jgi:hypothetical protein
MAQEHLLRAKEAEARILQATAETNEERVQEETNVRNDRLRDAMSCFALSAGVLERIERCWALYYFAVCTAKLGHEGAARDELLRARTELIPIREELLKKEPGRPGIGTMGVALCLGAAVYWLMGGWLIPVVTAAVIWLLSASVVTGVSSTDANDLVEVCELGRKLRRMILWHRGRFRLGHQRMQTRAGERLRRRPCGTLGFPVLARLMRQSGHRRDARHLPG